MGALQQNIYLGKIGKLNIIKFVTVVPDKLLHTCVSKATNNSDNEAFTISKLWINLHPVLILMPNCCA